MARVTQPPVSGVPARGGNASDPAEGWWIIVGTFPTDPWQRQQADFETMQSIAANCGLQVFNDLSGKFRGFTPGYNVLAIGAFADQLEAGIGIEPIYMDLQSSA